MSELCRRCNVSIARASAVAHFLSLAAPHPPSFRRVDIFQTLADLCLVASPFCFPLARTDDIGHLRKHTSLSFSITLPVTAHATSHDSERVAPP